MLRLPELLAEKASLIAGQSFNVHVEPMIADINLARRLRASRRRSPIAARFAARRRLHLVCQPSFRVPRKCTTETCVDVQQLLQSSLFTWKDPALRDDHDERGIGGSLLHFKSKASTQSRSRMIAGTFLGCRGRSMFHCRFSSRCILAASIFVPESACFHCGLHTPPMIT